jgi:hypothetical protein
MLDVVELKNKVVNNYIVTREDALELVNVDLNELGSYLSNSPLLIAYSKYSDDRIKVDEYLHICSELKKSEMKLEKFLSKRNETI